MGLIFQNWYDQNSRRNYPLEDAASGISDAGLALASDILVDTCLRFPSDIGNAAFLSSVTLSPGLVTLTFQATQYVGNGESESLANFVPLAAVSIPRPFYVGQCYPVTPFAAGVMGWVVLGNGANKTSGNYLFSYPVRSQLCARAASAYAKAGVSGLGREGLAALLTGQVKLTAGGGLEIISGTRNINGVATPAIVFQLPETENVLTAFAGPCGARPENDNCLRQPILQISGVTPDEFGNIEIVFEQSEGFSEESSAFPTLEVWEIESDSSGYPAGALVLEYGVGLAEVCPDYDLYQMDLLSSVESYESTEPGSAEPDVGSEGCSEIPIQYVELFSTEWDVDCYWDSVVGAWTYASEEPEEPEPPVELMSDYTAAGFGLATVNGDYLVSGSYNGEPEFTNAHGWVLRWLGDRWAIVLGTVTYYYRLNYTPAGEYVDSLTAVTAGTLSENGSSLSSEVP